MLNVLHSLPVWLPQTSPWLHSQVQRLPAEIRSTLVCERTANLDQFAIDNLHGMDERPAWRRAADRVRHHGRAERYLAHLRRWGKWSDAAVLHSHWGESAWRDAPVSRALGVPHVVTFYGKDVNYYPRAEPRARERYRALFASVHAVLCEGPHMASCIVALGCPPEKVHVHHLGAEVDRIAFRPRAWDGREPLRVFLAASFREKKGLPDALEALGQLRAELPGLEITIIGDASDDPRSQPEKRRIHETIDRWGLAAQTRLLGYQPHRVYFEEAYRHHLFLSPSLTAADGDTEGGAPITLIEMAATGMPIVSTTHCDIPSVVLHGRTGWLAGERDVAGLVDHLRWWVAHPARWPAMLEAGRRHVEAEYDVVKQSVRLAEIYRAAARPR